MKNLDKDQREYVRGLIAEYDLQILTSDTDITCNKFLKEKGLLEEEFEVGKWYKNNMGSLFFVEEINTNRHLCGYGFRNDTKWCTDNRWNPSNKFNVELATDKEVEEALIKEAKKRGFKKGAKYIHIRGNTNEIVKSDFTYSPTGCHNLTDGGGGSVFDKGKWAEIVKDNKEDVKIKKMVTPHRMELVRKVNEIIDVINK